MYCPQCGSSQSDSASNCSNCKLNLAKSTPLAPYFERVESNFHSSAMLLFLFPLVGLLARTQVDHVIVQLGGLAVAVICPLIGIGNLVVSAGADAARASNNLPGAHGKAKLAKTLKLAGYAIGFPILCLIVAVAFLNFLNSGGHGEGGGEEAAEVAAETAPAEGAPAEGAAAEGAAAEGADAKAAEGDAKKEETKPETK